MHFTMETSRKRLPNPIYKRVTRSAKPPTITQTLALFVNLMLFSFLIAVLVGEDMASGLFAIAVLTNFLVAPIVGGFAALITANDASHEGFVLQKITLLRREAVVGAYCRAALFRACLLLALALGLLPILGSLWISFRSDECHIFMPRSEYASDVPPNLDQLCASEGDIRFLLCP